MNLSTCLRQVLKTLPADAQDAIATRLLAELEDETKWKLQFEATTDDDWDRMVERVRREIASLEGDRIYWFWIGAHAEYDELLQRL